MVPTHLNLRIFSFFLLAMSSAFARHRAMSGSLLVSSIRNGFALKNSALPMGFIQHNALKQDLFRLRSHFRANHLARTFAVENSSMENTDANTKQRRKKQNNKIIKEKRREFIGKAKAVDRGQWSAVYSPGGKDCVSFEAKSGLPDRTKPFTVLGIESSCDDTGGMFLFYHTILMLL